MPAPVGAETEGLADAPDVALPWPVPDPAPAPPVCVGDTDSVPDMPLTLGLALPPDWVPALGEASALVVGEVMADSEPDTDVSEVMAEPDSEPDTDVSEVTAEPDSEPETEGDAELVSEGSLMLVVSVPVGSVGAEVAVPASVVSWRLTRTPSQMLSPAQAWKAQAAFTAHEEPKSVPPATTQQAARSAGSVAVQEMDMMLK